MRAACDLEFSIESAKAAVQKVQSKPVTSRFVPG
jgi:hypothetical protein